VGDPFTLDVKTSQMGMGYPQNGEKCSLQQNLAALKPRDSYWLVSYWLARSGVLNKQECRDDALIARM